MCNLSDNIYDYYNVSQGKITIPSMDDGEEFDLTNVSFYDGIESIRNKPKKYLGLPCICNCFCVYPTIPKVINYTKRLSENHLWLNENRFLDECIPYMHVFNQSNTKFRKNSKPFLDKC